MRRAAAVVAALALVLPACSDSGRPQHARSNFDPFATNASAASAAPAVTPTLLAVGDCFDTDSFAPGTAIARNGIHVVDCAQPHQHQVYAVLRHPEPLDAAYPGDGKVSTFADDNCLHAFEPAIGVKYQASELDFAAIAPDRASWDAGERDVVCAVHDTDFELLTGTQLALTASTTSPSLPSKSG